MQTAVCDPLQNAYAGCKGLQTYQESMNALKHYEQPLDTKEPFGESKHRHLNVVRLVDHMNAFARIHGMRVRCP